MWNTSSIAVGRAFFYLGAGLVGSLLAGFVYLLHSMFRIGFVKSSCKK